MSRTAKYILLLCCMVTLQGNLYAQQPVRILFLLDASLSMRNKWTDDTKWQTAIDALSSVSDSLSRMYGVEFGLRVFGHQYPEPDKNCKDTRLEVAIDSNNAVRVKRKLAEIKPKGITPLFYSIEKCAADFGSVPARNILILITDGEEACEGDPCLAALRLQQSNIILRPFVVGMSLHPTSVEKLACVGKLFNTQSSDEFAEQLHRTVYEAIAKTTLQIKLNDQFGKPTESSVAITLMDSETGLSKQHFYHTMNARGVPDTFTMQPNVGYNMVVHTKPPVFKTSIQLEKSKHNVVEVNAPQGGLQIQLSNGAAKGIAAEKIVALVYPILANTGMYVQPLYVTDKYLVGNYRLEVLTLPPTVLNDVKIDQSKTTQITIPAPGLLTVQKSGDYIGAILLQTENGLKKVVDLVPSQKQEVLPLQPGKYTIVYRSKHSRSIHTTVEKQIDISSGGSVSLRL